MKENYYVEYDKEENMFFIYRRFPNEIKLPLRLVCDKLNSQSDLIEDFATTLALTEKALELACEEIGGCRNDCSLPYMNACNPSKCIYAVEDKPSYFKTKAKEMKNEA